jgi:hypothetical protein
MKKLVSRLQMNPYVDWKTYLHGVSCANKKYFYNCISCSHSSSSDNLFLNMDNPLGISILCLVELQYGVFHNYRNGQSA